MLEDRMTQKVAYVHNRDDHYTEDDVDYSMEKEEKGWAEKEEK